MRSHASRPGAGPRFRFIASIVAGSARGWESLKARLRPALWHFSAGTPNPRFQRSFRIARPACAALRRYTGRCILRLVLGSRSFRSVKIVSRSWCFLVGCCERANNALRHPSFRFRGGSNIGATGRSAAAAHGALQPRWASAAPARERIPRRWYRGRNLSRTRTGSSGVRGCPQPHRFFRHPN